MVGETKRVEEYPVPEAEEPFDSKAEKARIQEEYVRDMTVFRDLVRGELGGAKGMGNLNEALKSGGLKRAGGLTQSEIRALELDGMSKQANRKREAALDAIEARENEIRRERVRKSMEGVQ